MTIISALFLVAFVSALATNMSETIAKRKQREKLDALAYYSEDMVNRR